MEASLLPGLSAEEIARSRRPLEDAWTLPAAAYVRQDIHALETERILRRSWTPLARVDQVPEPGDFIAWTWPASRCCWCTAWTGRSG